MTFSNEELKILESIPPGTKHELLSFARFLARKAEEESKPDAEKKNRRSGGWVKGKIWMSDNFNDPLDFVSSDEMHVLEAMRENKKAELQEVAV